MSTLLKGFGIVHEERVRWGDLDALGHVNNTVFFRYFESARIAYFQGTEIGTLTNAGGVGPILAQTSCQFLRPIHYPQTLLIGTRVKEVRTSSFSMEYVIVDAAAPTDPPFARGDSVAVMIDYGTGQKVPVSDALKKKIAEIDAR
jgi:acyl-CoA thioester hydrolase